MVTLWATWKWELSPLFTINLDPSNTAGKMAWHRLWSSSMVPGLLGKDNPGGGTCIPAGKEWLKVWLKEYVHFGNFAQPSEVSIFLTWWVSWRGCHCQICSFSNQSAKMDKQCAASIFTSAKQLTWSEPKIKSSLRFRSVFYVFDYDFVLK